MSLGSQFKIWIATLLWYHSKLNIVPLDHYLSLIEYKDKKIIYISTF